MFDLDGVLIDSEPVWEQVRRELVEERGGRWLPEAQSRLMGMSTPEWAQYLHEEVAGDLPPDHVAETVIHRMAAHYTQRLPLLPDATETLHRGAGGGVWGWRARLREPDVYRAAVQQLQTEPGSAVAVEDSTNGMRSAAAAGLSLNAIPRPGHPPADDALKSADLVLPSLADLSVATIESLA